MRKPCQGGVDGKKLLNCVRIGWQTKLVEKFAEMVNGLIHGDHSFSNGKRV